MPDERVGVSDSGFSFRVDAQLETLSAKMGLHAAADYTARRRSRAHRGGNPPGRTVETHKRLRSLRRHPGLTI